MIVPKPEKLSSGVYRVRLRLDVESISITRPTAREATREAEKIKADYRNGIRNVPTGGAVRLYDAIESFIAGRENVLSPSTLRGYRGIQRNHFRSYMSKRLDAIDWQAAINIEARTNSPKTVKNYWWFITGVLKDNGITPPYVRLPAAENQTGAVVTTHIGTLSKNVEAACKRAGLPNVTAHGLRHSFASLCYSLGLGELDTMRLGGWSDYQTMRKIYTHLSEGDKQKSVARITDYFRNAHGNAHGKPKTL